MGTRSYEDGETCMASIKAVTKGIRYSADQKEQYIPSHDGVERQV